MAAEGHLWLGYLLLSFPQRIGWDGDKSCFLPPLEELHLTAKTSQMLFLIFLCYFSMNEQLQTMQVPETCNYFDLTSVEGLEEE